jgi:hypothetical protein
MVPSANSRDQWGMSSTTGEKARATNGKPKTSSQARCTNSARRRRTFALAQEPARWSLASWRSRLRWRRPFGTSSLVKETPPS